MMDICWQVHGVQARTVQYHLRSWLRTSSEQRQRGGKEQATALRGRQGDDEGRNRFNIVIVNDYRGGHLDGAKYSDCITGLAQQMAFSYVKNGDTKAGYGIESWTRKGVDDCCMIPLACEQFL